MSDVDLARRIAMERNDAARCALAGVLTEIDGLGGNEIYRRAWKKLAVRIQQMRNALETVNTLL